MRMPMAVLTHKGCGLCICVWVIRGRGGEVDVRLRWGGDWFFVSHQQQRSYARE